MNRRTFIQQTLLSTAALAALPACTTTSRKTAFSQARIIGANENIRVAVVGFGGRGGDHISGFRGLKGVRIAALCDVDRTILDKELGRAKDKGEDVQGFTDLRDLLERGQVDVVSIATPNHWHALGAIWAMQAGKDVYVEKPVSHNVFEGRKLVEAARKYGRMVQAGTQCRSSAGLREAMAWLHAGNLGRIIRARGLCYKRRASIGKTTGDQPIPANVDYNLWLGPAPMKPLRRARLHYDWHWVWDTGNGDLGNQGIHQVDIARWALRAQELSPGVLSLGGRLGYEDDGETPNTLIVFHDYKPAPLLFEVRGLPSSADAKGMDDYRGASIGVVVDCEAGSMVIPSYSKAIIYDRAGKEVRTFDGGGNHYQNFIDAVRNRRTADLNGEILEGHLSSALCHTANISYRLGQTGTPDSIRAAVKNNKEMTEMLGRMEIHLAANKVDLRQAPAVLGEYLKMNGKTERFSGNRKANALLTREYRKPFVVPERV
ncbi:MAG TPA: Gfo/Idh/MocA family oxidoreductase [Verrucomicrobiae bacterium]